MGKEKTQINIMVIGWYLEGWPDPERGLRALEQRLAEKLATVRNAEGTLSPKQQREDAKDDASDKV